jgi:hypothetical protein
MFGLECQVWTAQLHPGSHWTSCPSSVLNRRKVLRIGIFGSPVKKRNTATYTVSKSWYGFTSTLPPRSHLKLDRSKLIPDTAMYAFTSTIQLEAFYGCGTQLLLESLLLTAARPEPPDGPQTAGTPCLRMDLSRHLRPRTCRGQLDHGN